MKLQIAKLYKEKCYHVIVISSTNFCVCLGQFLLCFIHLIVLL